MDWQHRRNAPHFLRHLATLRSPRSPSWWDAPTRSIVGATLAAGLLLSLLLFGTTPVG